MYIFHKKNVFWSLYFTLGLNVINIDGRSIGVICCQYKEEKLLLDHKGTHITEGSTFLASDHHQGAAVQ